MLKNRQWVCVLMAVALCLNLSATAALSANAAGSMNNFSKRNSYTDDIFSDVKQSDWFYESVKNVYEYGLMNGKGDRKFDPHGNVTYSEILAIAARIYSIYHTGSDEFEVTSPWYEVYGQYAKEHGVVDIYQKESTNYPGKFHYKITEEDDFGRTVGTITNPYYMTSLAQRIEVACILARTLPNPEFRAINNIPENGLPDVNMTDLFAEEVYRLYNAGILTGGDAYATFSPDANITRCEVATIIMRLIDPLLRRVITLKEDDRIITGDCGQIVLPDGQISNKNLQYTLDMSSGELHIAGSGTMENYYHCFGRPWQKYVSKIKHIVINEGVTTIGDSAFQNCTNLETVDLPESITKIGECAFQNCSSLKSIHLPDGIDTLHKLTFADCTALEEITLPASLKELELSINDLFDGHMFSLFRNCKSLTHIEIPEGVTLIRVGMFRGCTNLTSVIIPSTVVGIEGYAFKDCINLRHIEIPNPLVEINPTAFENCPAR